MDVTVEEKGTLTRAVTITLPSEDVQKKLKKEYDKLQKDAKLKGFRRGKVPRSIIEKSYKSQVEAEVGEKLVQESYFDAIEREHLDVVVHPEITEPKFQDDGSFSYVAMVDTRPVFELENYKGVEIEKVSTEVDDQEIDREIERIRKQMAPLRTAERAVADGDIAIVDYQGYHKENPMKQVKNENASIEVGAGQMGIEFEKKLIGMSKGDQADHEVTFPEQHPNPILAGKTVTFKITLKDVKEKVLAELDDEFAKDVSEEFATLDELKKSLRERLEAEKIQRAEGQLTDRIMQVILKDCDFEVPKRLVDFEVEQMIKQTEEQLQQSGMTLEAAGLSREMLITNNVPVATQRVRGDFVLKKISELEEIKLNDDDMNEGFQRIGDQYNMSVTQVKEFFKSRDDLLPLMNELLNEKVLKFLRDEAKLVDSLPEEEKVEETEAPAQGETTQEEASEE